ncbi:MAG: hypothetical protein HZA20_14675 [Nitrospirae bacterium]|nr:hypothetical protein [Nitrospirota bacterium]
MKRTCMLILALMVVLIPVRIAFADDDDDDGDNGFTATPPFVSVNVKPNMLLLLDNSASMNDLEYINDSTSGIYCYANNYSNAGNYAGYFDQTKIYAWDSGDNWFESIDALSASCSHRTPYLCVDIVGAAVTKFQASGRFLNWLSASKIDVLKKILTGGKMIHVNEGEDHHDGEHHHGEDNDDDGHHHALSAESRGCLGKRFIKAAPSADFTTGGAITFGINAAYTSATDPLVLSAGANTKIEIFSGTYNATACQNAIANIDNQGQFKQNLIDCFNLGGPDNSFNGAARAAFNVSTQSCVKLNRGQAIPNGDYVSLKNHCKKLYESIAPANIKVTDGYYVCADAALKPGSYLGQCWVDNGNNWSANGNCEQTQLAAYCGYMNSPQVVDPSDSPTPTGGMSNLPAILNDSGILGQLGQPKGSFPVKIQVPHGDDHITGTSGLIPEFDSEIRFGAMRFNYCGSASESALDSDIRYVCKDPANSATPDRDGGKIISYIGSHHDDDDDHGEGVSEAVNDMQAATWTPFAEAYYNAIAYFVKDATVFSTTNSPVKNPLNATDFESGRNPIQYQCQPNNVLIISDGGSTADLNATMTAKATVNPYKDADVIDRNNCGMYSGSTYVDDLSWFAKNKNIFDPNAAKTQAGQSISTWVVYTGAQQNSETGECHPMTLMQNTATNGGTTMYAATDADSLETSLGSIFSEVSKKSASGTGVSVLATSGDGEGAMYQAYFLPEKTEGSSARQWLGYLQAFFVDKYGNMREDTNADDRLTLTSDNIIEMAYDADQGTLIKKYADANGDGARDSADPSSTVTIENFSSPIWDGGKKLWEKNAADRKIFTTINGYDFTGLSSNATKGYFHDGNNAELKPWLRAADNTESSNIINWIRGDAVGGYRSRDITMGGATHVWKLGDIVYSTPVAVSKATENYDIIYNDTTYSAYRSANIRRRQAVYVGANDGMLHAFNGGYYDSTNKRFCTALDGSGLCTSGSPELGDELWSFVPRAALPHLKSLTASNYAHEYYVDLKPKISDVKIFSSDATHASGWGTVLIGGMRFGGKQISWTSGGSSYSTKPEYFAMDVTDPASPRLLWTFSHSSLGQTMSQPAIVKTCASGGSCKWFAVFGSGPSGYDSQSNLSGFGNGYVFVLDLTSGSNGVISSWTENSNYWRISTGHSSAFLADPVVVDVDMDYDADVIYIGENFSTGGEHDGDDDDDDHEGDDDDDDHNSSGESPGGSATGAFYGLKDDCWDATCATAYTSLDEMSSTTVCLGGGASCSGGTAFNSITHARGWVNYFSRMRETTDYTGAALNHTGERMFSKPLVIGGLVTWTTFVPGTDSCSTGGEGNLYSVYYTTGSAFKGYTMKGQKTQEASSGPNNENTIVSRVVRLGSGMPSAMSAQITKSGSAKGFAQSSTGAIVEVESITPVSMKSVTTGWKGRRIP